MSDFRGLIVAVSGPSGVGKGTVLARVEELLEQANPGSVGHSISVTTRAPRGQEQDGVEYFFRTKEEFEQMIKDGEIVEYDTYVDNYYGTPAGPLKEMVTKGQDVLFDITIEGSSRSTESLMSIRSRSSSSRLQWKNWRTDSAEEALRLRRRSIRDLPRQKQRSDAQMNLNIW